MPRNNLSAAMLGFCAFWFLSSHANLVRAQNSPNSDLRVISVNRKWGYRDQTGKIVVEPQFDYADPIKEGRGLVRILLVTGVGSSVIPQPFNVKSSDFALVNVGGKWGFRDRQEKLVILPQFRENWSQVYGRYPHSKGLLTTQGSKSGFVDERGRVVIPLRFSEAQPFSEGLAAVELNGKGGFIDNTGRVAIALTFEKVKSFSEGLAPARTDNRWGYIDKTGSFVINPKYEDCSTFFDGFAAVKVADKWGLIDKTGREVAIPKYDFIYWRDGFNSELLPVEEGNHLGYINKRGELAIEMKYGWAGSFSEGLAVVSINEKYGFIDSQGQVIIGLNYDDAQEFHEGLAKVKVNEKAGYIDRNGTMVIPPQFDDSQSFSEGYAVVIQGNTRAVRSPTTKYSYIDKGGSVVIAGPFDYAGAFHDGVAYVEIGNRQCEIEKTGKPIFCSSPN